MKPVVILCVRGMLTNVGYIQSITFPVETLMNMNSDTLERIWGLHQYPVGDVSGHWSAMSA